MTTRLRIRRHAKRLFVLAAISTFALGCELIVDFDRTKIPVESTETGPPPDATIPETSTDGQGDAPSDAPNEGSTDAGDASDAPSDGDADVGVG